MGLSLFRRYHRSLRSTGWSFMVDYSPIINPEVFFISSLEDVLRWIGQIVVPKHRITCWKYLSDSIWRTFDIPPYCTTRTQASHVGKEGVKVSSDSYHQADDRGSPGQGHLTCTWGMTGGNDVIWEDTGYCEEAKFGSTIKLSYFIWIVKFKRS